MKANRRSFLGMLAASPIVAACGPAIDAALKVLPAPIAEPVAKALGRNTIITPTIIAEEALRLLQDNLELPAHINRKPRSARR